MRYFVTAIGTDSGKTIVSAILLEALKADYWKPIQAGEPSDTDTVKELVSNTFSNFHPEAFRLSIPASPHIAAKIDNTQIRIEDLELPQTSNDLIIEGAGGLLVPFSQQNLVIDLISHFQSKVILVSDLYLGSINHTLLSIEAINIRNLEVAGIVFNRRGRRDYEQASEQIILDKSGYKCLLRIDERESVTKEFVRKQAEILLTNWNE